MVGNVRNEKSFFSMLLIWTSVVLQWIGALLLAGGAIVIAVALTRKVDSVNWIALFLGGAALSANLGAVCLILGHRKRSCRDLPVNSLPLYAEAGNAPAIPVADEMAQSEDVCTLFSDFINQPSTHVKIVR
jgi:hypothetical protein